MRMDEVQMSLWSRRETLDNQVESHFDACESNSNMGPVPLKNVKKDALYFPTNSENPSFAF